MIRAGDNLALGWARLMIEELWRLGLRDLCFAPGSRSAPLTLAASELDANAGLVRISATSPAMEGSTSTTQRSPRHVTALIVTLAVGEAEAATSRAITGTRHSWRLRPP